MSELQELLAAASRVTGLRVIFRDIGGRADLASGWASHEDPACRRAKSSDGMKACIAFCAGSVLRELAEVGSARIHTCPFGHTEIAVPVHSDGRFLGVLFAGPCHLGPGRARPDLVRVTDRAWLVDRQRLLVALADSIAAALTRAEPSGNSRVARITAYIAAHLGGAVTLTALAAHLDLSPSRTGHLVKDHFGLTVPALVRRTRMEAAARMLTGSTLSIAAIAQRVGCRDRDWFTRHFRAVHGCTPAVWRERSV